VGIFWAFSNEQFDEGKAKYPLEDGVKYQSIGAGGYFAGQHKEEFVTGMVKLNEQEAGDNLEAFESIVTEMARRDNE